MLNTSTHAADFEEMIHTLFQFSVSWLAMDSCMALHEQLDESVASFDTGKIVSAMYCLL